jgi:hypothetical protein
MFITSQFVLMKISDDFIVNKYTQKCNKASSNKIKQPDDTSCSTIYIGYNPL